MKYASLVVLIMLYFKGTAQNKSSTSFNIVLQKTVLPNAISLDDAATVLQACHYIVAIQGNKKEAASFFKQALLIYDNFLVAKLNAEVLLKEVKK